MMRSAALVLLVFLGSGPALALEDDFKTPETELILAAQEAVRGEDKAWFAARLHLPVRYFGKKNRTIQSTDWFLRHYADVIGPELKQAILAQDPEDYLKNYQGLMVGSGGRNIWFRDFGDDNGVRYEIVTINNSE
jgi:hypothetical protein